MQTTVYYRSSRPEVFLGKGVLKICSKFTGKHPCRSAISKKLKWAHFEPTVSQIFLVEIRVSKIKLFADGTSLFSVTKDINISMRELMKTTYILLYHPHDLPISTICYFLFKDLTEIRVPFRLCSPEQKFEKTFLPHMINESNKLDPKIRRID